MSAKDKYSCAGYTAGSGWSPCFWDALFVFARQGLFDGPQETTVGLDPTVPDSAQV